MKFFLRRSNSNRNLLGVVLSRVLVSVFILAIAGSRSFGQCGTPNPCYQCSGQTIVVDQNVTIDFNTAIPTYSGDPDLQPYFTYDKSGATPDTWKAIFDVGNKKLLIKSGATITVTNVPNSGNNQYAPGIVIKSTCGFEMEPNSHVVVNSLNKQGGDILILVDGNILINGEVRNEVSGTNGMPGAITISSKCGSLIEGSTGLIVILGTDIGGNLITLYDCGANNNGNITINGLVKSFASAHAGDLTLNRPNIRVVAFNGSVTINANTAEPLYDEFSMAGGLYDIYGGLLSWVKDNVNPGKVEVQARYDITVNGHGTDPTGPVRESFGAIAAIGTASSAPGGLVDVRSTEGRIIGNDRSFDVSGRNRLSSNFAHIRLWAKGNILLNRPGASANFNPVVDASSPSTGDKGGTNEIRSFSGLITIGTNALVSAAVPPGSGTVQGTNLLTSCGGVTNNGTVDPADAVPGDNVGTCGTPAPAAIYTDCLTITGVFDVIVDVEPPVFTFCPPGSDLGCNPTTFPPPGNATATDNSGTVFITSTLGDPVNPNGCNWTRTRTYLATDGCGNTATCLQIFTYRIDHTKPTITVTAPGTLPCNPSQGQINGAFGTATATDDCSTELTPSGSVGTEFGSGCNFASTKTWTVTDNCGNSQTASQTIFYTRDLIKPTITVTPPGAIPCNPTDVQVTGAFGTASATDNCCQSQGVRGVNSDANRQESVSDCVTFQVTTGEELGTGCTRTKTRIWTATDACGNTQTATQTLTYTRDVIKPTISITASTTPPCNPTQGQINAAFGTASVTDNCSNDLTATGVVGTETGSGCTFQTTKTWTVTDACGNSQTASQTVTYTRDVIKPTISITASGTLPCNPNIDQILSSFGTASVTDNCSTGLQASASVGQETGSGCTFSTTKTWTVTDACGNSQTASQTVTYTRDVIKPTISITASTTPPCNPTQAQINAAFGTASVTDNCSTGLTATGVVGTETGSGCTFSTTKTWTVTDACGNSQTASQTVTYTRDVIKPTISITASTTPPCNPTQAQINAAFGTASVTDNCSSDLTATGVVGTETGSGCTFQTTKTWTVTDACGNSQTASQTVTYTRDVIKPTISITASTTPPCNPTQAQINAAFGTASVTDNCSTGLTATGVVGTETGSGCTFSTTKTWTVTDACGNSQTASQTVTYTRDVIKPTISITASTTPPCNPTQAQINAAFGTASVTDNCSNDLTATGVVGTETGSGCTFQTTKTWTVTDACGNSQTASQTVTYTRDVIKPTISITASTTPPCNPTQAQINAAFGTASVTDNCSSDLTATGVVGTETGSGCTFQTTKTWTVTDACGNSQTASQTVTYTRDVIKPTILITASTTPPCNPTQAQINAAFGTASVTDNCSNDLTATGVVGTETGSGCTFSTTKTWTVTDACGNSQTASQTVTYTRDVIKPTISITASTTPPCNPTQAQINAAFGTASVTDNCSNDLTATGVVGTETGSGCTFQTTKTWTVTDACGNSQTASQTVTYTRDVIKPTITITPPSALPCNPTQAQINAAFGTASATDNCTTELSPSGSVGQEFGSGCNFATTKTWTVTDNCGNVQTASQTIFYTRDLIKPTITLTSAGQLPCNPTDAQISAAFCTASATDNCCPQGGVRGVNDGNREEIVSECVTLTSTTGDEQGTGCTRTKTRIWTATDACGNTQTATCTLTYTRDVIKPTISITASTTPPCNPTQAQINAAFGTASVTDNCSDGLQATGVVGTETGSGCTFQTTKTWTVTDACGNSQTASQTVTYTRDVIKPTISITASTTPPCNPTQAQINAAFGTASVTDNCSNDLTATGVVGTETGSGCTFSTTKTWTVTDACGNSQTASQTVTYTRDVIKPTISITASGTLPCNPNIDQILSSFGTASVTDNCSTGLQASASVGQETGSGCTFSTTKTWTVTDACGNSQTASQTVTYTRDVIKPTISITASGNLPCNPNIDQILSAFGTASVTDNCSTGLQASASVGQETGSGCTFSTTKTWTVTDACGNSQTASQTVTYTRDVIKPTISITASTTPPCNPTQAQINAAFGTASVTDNCSTGLTATGVVGTETGSGCTFQTTKTWTVTDACGNSQTASQTVTYTRDVIKPTISITASTTPPCNPTQAQINAAFGTASVTDNCSNDLTATGVVGTETGSGCTFQTTKTWTVTDACGNSQTASQTVTYTRDVIKPTISITASTTPPCNPTQAQINAAFGTASVTDNCSNDLTATGVVGTETGSGCTFQTTKTWTVTDACGNSQTASQTVTYTRDVIKPTISITASTTPPCNPTQAQINAAFGTASVTDNCSNDLTATGVVGTETGSGCTFQTTKTWTVTDACGNSQTASQTVTYTRDVIKPTISITASGTLPCNPNIDQILSSFGTASVTDNCSTGLQASASVGQETGSGCTFSTTKTWTVTDACGNSQTASQTVTYTRDVIKPTISITASTTPPCNPTQAQINAAFGTASVTDNCSTGLTATGVVGTETGSGCTFQTTKTWTVTDACGNSQTASQTVTYTRDVIKPTITITPPSALPCNPTQAQINAAFGTASATDNCTTELSPSGSVGQEFGSGCNFATTKTWTVTDNCGNVQTASQTIFYTRDLIKPTITLTSAGQLPCNPTDTQINAAFCTASATDNCCPQGGVRGVNDGNREEIVSECVTLTFTTGDEQGTGCTRTKTRIWTATDACGNTQTATCTLTYTRDVIKPTISITASTTPPCNPTQAQINAAFGTASVTDNCSDGLQATGVVGSETGSGCTFQTTKTWTVTDACGNSQTASQTVTYTRDVIKPTISITASTTPPCNPTQGQINAAFGTASVTDNCSNDLTATGVVGTETGSGCTFQTTKTWTVTDACGNSQTASQTVTYTRDVIKPTISITASGTLPCNPNIDQILSSFGTASVTDNCSTGLQASASVGQETGSGCTFSTTKTWTVTDACGNSQTASQTVTYTRDVIKPTISITASTTPPCNPTQAQINAAFGTASVTDNCSTGLTATGVVGTETGSGCTFSTTKTWTVTDACGNSQTASQTVTYTRDVIKPTISITASTTPPCNPTQAQINAAFGTASVTDNCSSDLTATGVVGTETGSGCTFQTTKTWTVTDACGNSQTASQTVTYTRDVIKPTISITASTTPPCNPTQAQINAAFGTASVTDNCSNDLTATGVVGTETGSGCTFQTTKTWTVTDACGNSQTASQTVTYTRDVIKPTISITASTTPPCNPTQAQINAAFGTASVTDNCSNDLTATGVVGTETGSGCTFQTTKTWTVTDACGNSQTASQTVTYTRDVIKPTISITASTTPPCNPTQAQINAAFGTASVTDNCSTGLTATGVVGTETGSGCTFQTTKTWTVTDACGNSQTASQTVTYTRDVIKPTISITASTTPPCNPTQAQINAAFGTASVTDNCSSDLTATGVVGTETGSGCTFSTTKTWTVTDACGNSQTASQTVSYTRDVIKPTISITASTTPPCNPTQAQINAAFGTASVTDNCSTGLTATGVVGSETGSGCTFQTTKTWTVTDACGNSQTASQTVTYTRDVIKPTITVTPSSALPCNPTQAQINAAFGTASVTDNCSVELTATGVVGAEFGSGCNFATTKTWTVTDNCGNTQTASQTIFYTRDLVKPTITLTAQGTLPCNPTDAQINTAFGTASATDNCCPQGGVRGVNDANRVEAASVDCVTIQVTTGEEQGTGCIRTKTRIWTATDACGNTQTSTRTLTYTRDVIKPTITISGAGTLPCNPTSTQINAAFGTASVTDNCSDGLQATGVVGSETGSGCTFQTTKTWTVTDACGNIQTASQTLTYTRDVTPPVITPTGTTLTLGCNPTSTQINAALGTATASDNCCLQSNVPSDGPIISNGCNRSQTRTWLATDCCGNTATASRTVTWIRDVTPPQETTPCIQCDGVIVVDQNVTINFNTAVPTYTGDPDLQPYFAYDNSGPTADTWKAIFNLGNKKLLVKNGATITVTNVPTTGNNQYAPGILIRGLCGVEIEDGGHIVVNSLNKNTGDIVISVNGDIIINGEIRNEVSGTNGIPGAITITSKCGNITEGSTGLVEILGQDNGGNTISIVTCGDRGSDGDITINGLVKSFAHAHGGDQNLNRPNIRVISFNGKVTVNANTVEPLYDEFQVSGSKYDIWGGLLSWVRDNVIPGKVEVQAKKDITVNGHGIDPTGPVRTSFGAIAAVATASDAPGGLVDVRSLEGKIIGNDRAFDVSGRNRLATNYAHIILWSKGDIVLSRPGANSGFNPVVDASSPSVGDKGGLNELRSFAGHIIINANALVSAAVPFGNGSVQGINLLTTCGGLTNNGSVVPADLTTGDDVSVCGTPAPTPLYTDCTRFFTPGDDLGCNPTETAINAAFGTVTGMDACGPVQVTFVDGPVVVEGCHRSKTRTWTITDNCGNTTTVTKTVTWELCPCTPGRGQQIVTTFGDNSANRLEVTAFPNPYEEYFTLRITPPVSGQATIRIYNLNGTLLGEIKKDAKAYSELFVSYYVPALYRTRIVYNVTIGSFTKTGIVLSPN